jgi:hypothetical protein
MKLSLSLVLLTALLSACSRPVVRETVIERPGPVVTKETTVERPAAVGATAPNCIYASQSYSSGSVSCQERTEYRCNNGVWERTINAC